jgi:glycosyltransferase involved in cell wall biosynthesis
MKVFHLTTVHSRYDNRIFNKQCISLSQYFKTYLVVSDGLGDEQYANVNIIDVGIPINRLHRMLVKSFAVFNLARNNGADIYQIHDPELLFFGFFYSLTGKKVIYDIHEDYTTSLSTKSYLPLWIRKTLPFIFNYVEKFLSFKMKKLIAEKYYSNRFPDALTVLNYPLKDNLKDINAFEQKSLTLLYTGNITVDRGAAIIKQFANANVDLGINFKIVGKCSNLTNDHLELSDQLNIELIGLNRYVPFNEITSHYKMMAFAGIALFPDNPHYFEKELTKFFEYMAVGLPIIASNFPVWKKLIEDNGVGICIDISNPNEFFTAIEYLKNNPDEVESMSKNGKNLVCIEYNWESEFEKMLNFYKVIINT